VSVTVTVVHLIAGTVTRATHTGQQVTVQHHPSGLAHIQTYRDGRLTHAVTYRTAEVVTREYDLEDA
jgi:hypothetical protein